MSKQRGFSIYIINLSLENIIFFLKIQLPVPWVPWVLVTVSTLIPDEGPSSATTRCLKVAQHSSCLVDSSPFHRCSQKAQAPQTVLKHFITLKSSQQSISLSYRFPKPQFPWGSADGPRWMPAPAAGGVQERNPSLGILLLYSKQ